VIDAGTFAQFVAVAIAVGAVVGAFAAYFSIAGRRH
jgi:hypothetical protein